MFSSGTLGFCFIFRFLFGYGGTFTHVFWPMQGSPPAVSADAETACVPSPPAVKRKPEARRKPLPNQKKTKTNKSPKVSSKPTTKTAA